MRKLATFALLTASLSIATAASFIESFDDPLVPTGVLGNAGPEDIALSSGTWVAHNQSTPLGVTGWFRGNLAVFDANSGDGYLGANFNNTSGGTGTINNWFYSPVLTFNNGDAISFYTRVPTGSAWADRLHLKLSTNGDSVNSGDFTTTLVSVNPNLGTDYPDDWTQFSAIVSGLGGPVSGRFAFHYDVIDAGPSGTHSNFIGIDDVSYEAVPEPATMAILGLGALAALKRRRK